MSFNCCDVPAYLSSFPETWRKELSDVLCLMYASVPENFACETVKGCETKTTIDSLVLSEANVLTLTYTGESGVAQTKSANLASLVGATVTADNGLQKLSGVIELGGNPLTKNTTLTLGTFNLSLSGSNIYFSSFPNTRNDASPLNFLFTDVTGKLQSANLKNTVETIAGDYINNILEVALGSQTGCLPVDWADLTLQEKMTAWLDVMKTLCECCESTSSNCSFTAAAIRL